MYVFLTADPQSFLYKWSNTEDSGAWRISNNKIYAGLNPTLSDLTGSLDGILHAIWSFERDKKDPITHGILLAKTNSYPVEGEKMPYRIEKAIGTIEHLPSYPTLKDIYNYWTAKYPLMGLSKNPSRTSAENRILLLWGESYVDQI